MESGQLAASVGPIGRHFCRVGGEWLHYRRMGQGPAVLLLHQTPQSSQTLEPLMRLLAAHCTAIAVDTPGFGQSDPLPQAHWSMSLLADRMTAFLDTLGIAQVSICGQHTGAAIGAEMALRHPHRVCSLALDGVPLFNADEQKAILPHQLYRFVPQVDGTHLMWAWSRFRDGWLFFPWSQRDLAHRRQLDFPGPDVIHRLQIMELLRSRESHLHIYPGVFAWDGAQAIAGIDHPTWIGTTADDQLFPHMDRLPAGSPHVQVHRLPIGARGEVLQAQARWTLAHLPAASAPAASPVAGAAADGELRAYSGGLLVQGRGLDQSGSAMVLLHGAGASGDCERVRLQGSPDGPVFTVDLPGHGDSPGDVLSCDGAARQLGQALDDLGLKGVQVRARGYGAAVAAHWALHCAARRDPGGCRPLRLDLEEVAMCDPATRSRWLAHYAAPIVPVWDGSHLIALWHAVRDRELFHPWFERQRTHIRTSEPRLDAESLTRSVFAALQCSDWVQAHRHWLEWQPQGPTGLRAVQGTGVPVQVHAVASDGWAQGLDAWLAPHGSGGKLASS